MNTSAILKGSDLLALPDRTVVIGKDTAVYVLIKQSFSYGPHLLLVSAGGAISRTPLDEILADLEYATGEFTAVLHD